VAAIGPRGRLAHRSPLRFLVVNIRDIAVAVERGLILLRPVSTVGPDLRAGIAPVENIAELRPVIGGSARHAPAADEAVPTVDGGMVFLAESRNGDVAPRRLPVLIGLCLRELDCPAGVAILLTPLRRLVPPCLRNIAAFDGRFFAVGVALLRCGHNGGVNDLAAQRQISRLAKRCIEAPEQLLHGARLHELFPKQPDRLGIGNPLRQPQTEKAPEQEAVLELEFGLVVRETIKG